MSLDNLAAMLAQTGKTERAIEVSSEALDGIWPFFEQHPRAFANLTYLLLRQATDLHEALSRLPPPKLPSRIELFSRLNP